MKHFMVDTETLSTTPGARIVSLAAAEFDIMSGDCLRQLSVDVDFINCSYGDVSAGTLLWWMSREPACTEQLFAAPRRDLISALESLSCFLTRRDNFCLWANSPQFDLVILKSAFDYFDIPLPWNYRDERCFRTVIALAEQNGFICERDDFTGTRHHAAADTLYQVKQLSRAMRFMRRRYNGGACNECQ